MAAAAARETPVPAAIRELPANGVLDLGPYRWTSAGGHSAGASITDYSGMAYDPRGHRFMIFGGGHASTDYDAVNSFDMRTLQWRELYPPTPGARMTPDNYDQQLGAWKAGPAGPYPRPAARHTVDAMAIANDSLMVFAQVEGNGMLAGANWPGKYTAYELSSRGRVAHLKLGKLEWTFSATDYGVDDYAATEYDPPSGKVIFLGVRGLWIYDPQSKTKSRAINFQSGDGAGQLQDEQGKPAGSGRLDINHNLVYFPPNQKHYYFNSQYGDVFEVTLDRKDFSRSVVRRVSTEGPRLSGDPATKFAYDAANKLIGGALWRGVFHAFDPVSRSWSSKKVSGPQRIAFMAMDYDPKSNVYVLLTPERRTWAYRWQ
jgi:hypothetical protein